MRPRRSTGSTANRTLTSTSEVARNTGPGDYAAVVTVPTSYAHVLLASVAEQGHDALALAAAESLTQEDLDQPLLPAAVFGRLYQRVVRVLQDESLGLISDGRVIGGTFRMLCLSVIACPDLERIIVRAGEFLDVARGVVVKPTLARDRQFVRIGFALTRGVSGKTLDEVLAEQAAVRIRTTIYLWHKLLTWFADRPLPLSEVRFAFEPPANGDAWERLFGCPVHFDCEQSEFVMTVGTLALANVQTERSLDVFLKTAPYQLIASAHDDQSLSERVRAIIGEDFTRPIPTAVETGRRLGLSVSTMRRRLLDEGTSFQTIKDESRRSAAIRYLVATELSPGDVASLLGFDEPSAFYRAFRRWTGTTPSRYRNDGLGDH